MRSFPDARPQAAEVDGWRSPQTMIDGLGRAGMAFGLSR